MNRTLSWVICLWLGAAAQAGAADRYDAAVAHEGRSAADITRDALDQPAQILRLSGIGPGMRVADVLAGDGYYSELLAYVVGSAGKILLLNNAAYDDWSQPDLQTRLAGNRLPNVLHETVNVDDMHLAANSLDAVLMVKVYHDLFWVDDKGKWPKIDPDAVLAQIATALKPGGVLLLVDHSARPGTGSSDASALHRIDETYTVKNVESHGLKVVGHSDLLRHTGDARDQISFKGPMLGKTDRFVVVFRKPG